MFSPLGMPNADHRAATSFGGILDMFREGTHLVEAAFEALERISTDLSIIKRSLRGRPDPASLAAIRRHIDGACVGDDNLLVADARRIGSGPLLVRALARDISGAMTIRDIPVERAPLAMIGDGDDHHPFDRLNAACQVSRREPRCVDIIVPALEAMAAQVDSGTSRLSVVKARLELQASFVAAVASADVAPIVQSPVDMTDARALALQTRRLLGGQSLDIGNSNRLMLQALFASQSR